MDKETQEWYENQFELFSTKGWKGVVETLEKMKQSYDTIANIPDEHTLNFRKGQLDVVCWLLDWENVVERTHKELTDEQS